MGQMKKLLEAKLEALPEEHRFVDGEMGIYNGRKCKVNFLLSLVNEPTYHITYIDNSDHEIDIVDPEDLKKLKYTKTPLYKALKGDR